MSEQKASELYFSCVARNQDGTKAAEYTILEPLLIEWDDVRHKWRAYNVAGEPSCVGYGDGHTDAIISYLRARLGLVASTKVKYSNRVY